MRFDWGRLGISGKLSAAFLLAGALIFIAGAVVSDNREDFVPATWEGGRFKSSGTTETVAFAPVIDLAGVKEDWAEVAIVSLNRLAMLPESFLSDIYDGSLSEPTTGKRCLDLISAVTAEISGDDIAGVTKSLRFALPFTVNDADNISRLHAAQMLISAVNRLGGKVANINNNVFDYERSDEIDNDTSRIIGFLVENSLMTGYSDGRLFGSWKDDLTAAQAIQMAYNLYVYEIKTLGGM